MHLVFGMVAAVFDFFANIADSVDFMGLNLWQISFIVFIVSCVFRWLFPVLFAGEGATPSGGFIPGYADSVKNSRRSGRTQIYDNRRQATVNFNQGLVERKK